MSSRTYVPSYRPSVFIKGFWVDDALGCEWQVTDPKEPLYGFRDIEFRSVAQGQTLVHGLLDINFRMKGYLVLALSRLETPDQRIARNTTGSNASPQRMSEIIHAAEVGNDFASSGIDPLSLSPEARRAFLEKSYQEFDIETFYKLSKAVREDLWDTTVDHLSVSEAHAKRGRAAAWPFPFDLTVVYDQIASGNDRDQLDNARVEIIRDVHIVGMSKMFANTVPGGAKAITERYQFIARTVE